MLLETIGHTKLIANSRLIDATKELNYSQNDRFIVFAVNFMRNHIEKTLQEKNNIYLQVEIN
jgi:DNA-directed RNA polymerase specialized sigma subunit